jgi:hypothetical protein
MNTMTKAICLGSFAAAAAVQPFVVRDPVMHMLVQYPLLAVSGFALGTGRKIPTGWVGPLLVLSISTLLFWMLPRSLDGALQSWTLHLGKFATLPLLFGMPLALTWPHLHPILRGILKAEAVSMVAVMSFLYTHAPIRICNSYLFSDQVRLGYGFAVAAIALAIVWSIPAFLGTAEHSGMGHSEKAQGRAT